ncbi:MAG: tetratricopeptide repeat protein [Curvibacter sp.]|nr:tetratricopeptide repeat protein [Curvibacter sp.]
MSDQERASGLAKQAFELWQSGKAESAIPFYQEALLLADPKYLGLPEYHGEFASVLSELGRSGEARQQFELALEVQRRLDGSEFTSSVAVARYFLAEHLRAHEEPQLALQTIEPSLKPGVGLEWLLRCAKAFALSDLEQNEGARFEAHLALETVKSDEKRSELVQIFSEKNILWRN